MVGGVAALRAAHVLVGFFAVLYGSVIDGLV
jgi:hypothetical protein